jgi:hypothetical protein
MTMSAVMLNDEIDLEPTYKLLRDLCLDAAALAAHDPTTRDGALHFAEEAAVHLETARGLVNALSEISTGGREASLSHALAIVLSLADSHLGIAIKGLFHAADHVDRGAAQPPASA